MNAAAQLAAARAFGPLPRPRRAAPGRRPVLVESDYAARLIAVAIAPIREASRHIDGELPHILRRDGADRDIKPDNVRHDEDPGRRARRVVDRMRAEVGQATNPIALEGVAQTYAKRVAAHGAAELARQSKESLGVELVAADRGLPHRISNFVHENVSRISSLQGRTLDDLERILTSAVTDGLDADAVTAAIAERFGIAERHARLIALDQIGKLDNQIARARHLELGITMYYWRHTPQPRPRLEHRARHGRRFRYDKPPADGHPGTLICCKCGQDPDFSSIEAEVEAESPLEFLARRRRELYGDGGYVHRPAAPRHQDLSREALDRRQEAERRARRRVEERRPPAAPGEPPPAPLPRARVVVTPGGIVQRVAAAIRRALRIDGELVAPPGFDADGKPLLEGEPARDEIKRGALYVVDPTSIRDRLVARPDGGDGSGPVAEERLQRVRDAWSEGTPLPHVELGALPDGKLLVIDGRHRITVALEQERYLLVRFRSVETESGDNAVPFAAD